MTSPSHVFLVRSPRRYPGEQRERRGDVGALANRPPHLGRGRL